MMNLNSPDSRFLALITGTLLAVTSTACSKTIHASAPPGTPAIDEDYMDVEAGWKLLVVVPLLKSGGFHVADLVPERGGETLSFSSKDVIGYTISNYAAVGKKNGAVRLQFTAAETTREGKTTREPHAPALPLELPKGTGHLRLVYEIRLTHTDHNMAIVAARELDALDAFTKKLEKDPSLCSGTGDVFCSWVPTGVAVRAERR